MNLLYYLFLYLFLINCLGFLLMGADKKRAVRHQWRIAEKTLFFIALCLGSLGTTLGMYVFRHKTKHWYFVIFMPLLVVLQTLLLAFALYHTAGFF